MRWLIFSFLIPLAAFAQTEDAGKAASQTASGQQFKDQAPPPLAGCDKNPIWYPAPAVRLNHEGETEVGFTVLETGYVTDVHVIKSSGHDELDEAAVEKAKCFTYRPAMQNGKPVAVPWKAVITWKLHG
ncbi:MAG TPA: energy transducer TonB [Rhizomicrobium sp.]|nr:energy transducer TonB [Rhizomicrobium sp.]